MIPGLRTYSKPEITEQVKGWDSVLSLKPQLDAQCSVDTDRFLSLGPPRSLYNFTLFLPGNRSVTPLSPILQTYPFHQLLLPKFWLEVCKYLPICHSLLQMCVSWYLSVLLKIFILLLKRQWLPSICKCNSLIAVRTLQKLWWSHAHQCLPHCLLISFLLTTISLEHWYCCKPIKTSVTFAHVPSLYFMTSFNSKTLVMWVSLYCFHVVIEKKIEVGDFLSTYKFPFTALKRQAAPLNHGEIGLILTLKEESQGARVCLCLQKSPTEILSYNSEDYTSSDFFFFSPIGLAKSFLKFSCNIVLKNLNELWVNNYIHGL